MGGCLRQVPARLFCPTIVQPIAYQWKDIFRIQKSTQSFYFVYLQKQT